MKQIESHELIKIRKFFHKKYNKEICPILKMKFDESEMVVDHAHKSNAKNLNKPEEAGLIRGVIHRQANTMEGKITNSFIRYGLHKFNITLPEFLRNLADFIENPPLIHKQYIHPSEKPKEPKLMKRSYNKLVKLHKENLAKPKALQSGRASKMPEFPKSGKLIKSLKKLYKLYNLEPEFLKN